MKEKNNPIHHCGTKEIITERLLLRRFKAGDEVAMWNSYVTDKEVTEYVTWEPHKNIDETKALVSMWVDGYSDKCYRWAICLKDSDDVIGSIDIVGAMYNFTTVETGYCLSRAHWGNGYMTEALTAVIDYMFDDGVNRVQAKHVAENMGSGKVMQKAGMTKEGVMRGAAQKHGRYQDLVLWAIVKTE